MWKSIGVISVVLAMAALAAGPSALAQGGGNTEVIKRGACSASSTWKLKAKLDDGFIETEFEVDQNVVGKKWRVIIRQNGVVRFDGIRTTQAPSGSFEVRRLLPDTAGSDHIVGRARALATGELCRGELTI